MLKKNVLLLFFILLKFIIQYQLVNPVYELHRDEYLHLNQGRHLAAGYISVPPLSAWIARLIDLLGNSEFWIRFFPALFGAITLVLVWKTMTTLKAGIFALVLGAIAIIFSALLRLNILFQPNSFDVMAWTFVYFCIVKYCSNEQNKWLWLAAAGLAIGFLNKYNIAFLLLGLLPAFLLTPQRNVFLKPAFYGALLLALLIISPNLIWQYQHGFPVVHHMKELTDTQLVNVSRTKFLQEQLLYFIGSFFVLIAGLLSILFYPPFKKYKLLLLSFIFCMALFLYFKAKGYYAIGLYPVFLAFGAVWLEQWTNIGWKKWTLRPLLILIPLLLFIPMAELAFPIKSPAAIVASNNKQKKLGMHRWEDGKDHPISQDFADMQGWKELATIVDAAYDNLADKQHTLVLSDNYGQAGAINHYSKQNNINALSFNADYINWFPENMVWKNLLLVKEAGDSVPSYFQKDMYDSVYVAGKISNEFAREKGTTVYVLKNIIPAISDSIYQKLKRRKNH